MSANSSATRAALLAAALLLGAATSARPGTGISEPYRLSPFIAPGQTHMGVRLLGSVALSVRDVDGLALGGLSALAWDQDESRLYALSDRGAVFHLRPHFEGGRLASVAALAAFALRDRENRPLQGPLADAEALVVQGANNGRSGDSVLVVAFERQPRILRFSPDGHFLDTIELPTRWRDSSRYAHPNKALEALTWLPGVGFLSGPERPLKGAEEGVVELFALDGRHWRYPLAPTPAASLVAMEALPDGSLLVLERGHGLMFLPIVIALRHTRLDTRKAGGLLPVTTLAVLDSSQGWSVDNFEGLARHRGLEFFMVSDDNFNDLQRTLLVYFGLTNIGDPTNRTNWPEFELRQETRD